jgi:ABC-type uncharacterized transport system ATPase subunit
LIGAEPTRGPLLELGPTADQLRALGGEIGLPIDPWAEAERLPLGAGQRAEIVAALHAGAKLLILGEQAVDPPVDGRARQRDHVDPARRLTSSPARPR